MPSDQAHSPIVFALHRIRGGRRWDHTNIQPNRLADIFSSLQDRGYLFGNLRSALSSTDSRVAAVTIDDGYAHLAEVLPLFCQRFLLRPHLFVPAGMIGKRNRWDYTSFVSPEFHLCASQIRCLADQGVIVGSHGWSHKPLINLGRNDLISELDDSKRCLEDITGRQVDAISYPFGRTDERVEIAAREAGFELGVTTRWPSGSDSRLGIGRILIYGFDTPYSVLQKLEGKLAQVERVKQAVATALSGGTGWYQRLTGQ